MIPPDVRLLASGADLYRAGRKDERSIKKDPYETRLRVFGRGCRFGQTILERDYSPSKMQWQILTWILFVALLTAVPEPHRAASLDDWYNRNPQQHQAHNRFLSQGSLTDAAA